MMLLFLKVRDALQLVISVQKLPGYNPHAFHVCDYVSDDHSSGIILNQARINLFGAVPMNAGVSYGKVCMLAI